MSTIASKGQLRWSFVRYAAVAVPLVLLLGFLSGRSVPTGSEDAWYVALTKPAVTPPGWVFPVAWTALYLMTGFALALILSARGAALRWIAVALFAGQFALNLAWTPIFFGAHRIGAAVLVIVAMLGVAILATIVFGRIRTLAAWLMVPYLAWIAFAGVLTWRIGQLNPDAANGAAVPAAVQDIGG